MYGTIVGKGGIDPDYFFYRMTLKEAFAIIKKFNDEYKQVTERTRLLAFNIAGPYLPKHTTIQKFWRLEWEKVEPAPVMKKVEFDKIVKDLKHLKVI